MYNHVYIYTHTHTHIIIYHIFIGWVPNCGNDCTKQWR